MLFRSLVNDPAVSVARENAHAAQRAEYSALAARDAFVREHGIGFLVSCLPSNIRRELRRLESAARAAVRRRNAAWRSFDKANAELLARTPFVGPVTYCFDGVRIGD